MIKKRKWMLLAFATVCGLSVSAQVTIKGVLQNNRYDDGDQLKTIYIGSLVDENGNYIVDEKGNVVTAFIHDLGIYKMTWDGSSLTTPAKEPAVSLSDIKQGGKVDVDKAVWANNFNLMFGSSGAVYVDGRITTVMSRDYQSTVDDELFAVRKWDAKSGNLLSGKDDYFPAKSNLESAGMAYNPKDGKVYGLFYMTDAELNSEIVNDPNYFVDDDDEGEGRAGLDAGYAICTIDLSTMTVKQVTPGLYYDNFVTFAINSEGRAFALTSGGTHGVLNAEGKMENIDGELCGAQLCEFDLSTGLMKTRPVEMYAGTDSAYTAHVNIYSHGTGYASQYKRQSACFGKSNPNKMYWNGFYNSGKGYNDYGSWSSLSDKEWRTNGKYDTCLYEVDITTGEATRLSKVPNRCTFSCIWVEGDDVSDGTASGIADVKTPVAKGAQIYNLSGQQQQVQKRGLNIVRNGAQVRKVMK